MSKPGMKRRMGRFLRLLPKKMRYGLMRKMLNLPEFPQGLSIEIANSQKDLDAAFAILYDTYRKEGITILDPSQRRVTIYHSLPSTTTVVAKQDGEVVATMSLIRDGKFGLPVDALVDLSQFRKAGKRMAEVSSLAVKSDHQGQSTAILFYLSKYLIFYCREYFGVDRMVIAVHPRRIAVYEALFLFKPFKKKVIDGYQFANDAPALTATLNLENIEERFYRVYHKKPDHQNLYQFLFKASSQKEKAGVKIPKRTYATIVDPVLTPDLMQYFFSKSTKVFETMTNQQLQELFSIYSHPAYQEVLPQGIPLRQDNKRESFRYDMRCYGLVYPSDKSRPVFVHIFDVSESGIQMYSDVQLDPEIAHTFHIVIGKENISTVKGRVKWSKDNVIGVQFGQMDDKWGDFIQYQHERIIFSNIDKKQDLQISAS